MNKETPRSAHGEKQGTRRVLCGTHLLPTAHRVNNMSWGLLGLLPIHLGKSRTRTLRTLSILSRKAVQAKQYNRTKRIATPGPSSESWLRWARVLPWLSRDSIKA